MPRYSKGDRSIETSIPAEGVELRAQGFKETKALTKAVREVDEQREQAAADRKKAVKAALADRAVATTVDPVPTPPAQSGSASGSK